ncbi:hypothetical protein AVEN_245827-1 [Araneus ventricosus]|uniref:Reverse transcriptase domain-containing protein n=1 Tax=Araneus ventricosus TaxID=182803 RepID=A0A4Y2E8H5_ARAVE|nr:hypothetical protein AVEN_245827-1 [Araneus ventricosus]
MCLLDAMGKILDKLITQRIFFHLLRNNLLSDRQYGFTPGRSVQDAILQLKSLISEARARKHHSIIVSHDIKSAFSLVWWPLVLHNLKSKSCPRNLFRVVSSFLEDRKVSISYSDTSLSHDYSIGCPQASGKHTIKTKVQEALFLLDRWSKKAKVTFSHEKTQLLPFGKKGRQKPPSYCFFNGRPSKLNRQMKILGVIIDDQLNGMAHINFLREKISKILNRLTVAKTRKGLSGRVLKALFKRALERMLVYAAPAWWTCTVNQCNEIISIQRQILLAVTGAFRTTSIVALHVINGIELIDLILEMETAMYRAKHGQPITSFLGRDPELHSLDIYIEPWQHPGTISQVNWDTSSHFNSLHFHRWVEDE